MSFLVIPSLLIRTRDMLTYEDKGRGCIIAFIAKSRTDVRGKRFKAPEAIRIIAEGGKYRLDYCGNIAGAWMPWEPIVDRSFDTIDAAKAVAEEYAGA